MSVLTGIVKGIFRGLKSQISLWSLISKIILTLITMYLKGELYES